MGKVPINKKEPKPKEHSGRVPGYLTKGGKWAWRKLAKRFVASGLLTTHDEWFFVEFCEWAYLGYKARHELEKLMDKFEDVDTMSGFYQGARKHPLLNVIAQSSDQCRKFGSLFGMIADYGRLEVGSFSLVFLHPIWIRSLYLGTTQIFADGAASVIRSKNFRS